MEGVFACPDCGSEIQIAGLLPGRIIECTWCSAQVEIPYFPRVKDTKRKTLRGHNRHWKWPVWVWSLIAILATSIGVMAIDRGVRSHWKTQEFDTLARLISKADAAEKAGQLSEALVGLEGALKYIELRKPSPMFDIDVLSQRRNELALREAKVQLANLEKTSSQREADLRLAIGRALTLLARTRADTAVEELENSVLKELDRLRTLSATSDGTHAQTALAMGDVARAAELSERQFRTAAQIPAAQRQIQQAAASALMHTIVRSQGVMIEFATSQFTLGSQDDYRTPLLSVLGDRLIKAGYFPKPSNTVFESLWKSGCIYRIKIQIQEHQDGRYYQSPNRLSYIQAHVEFLRGQELVKVISANTQSSVPLPKLSAYAASRIAVSDHRSPQFERLLYADARSKLVDRLVLAFQSLPRRNAA